MCHPVGGEEMTGRPHPAGGAISERGPGSRVHNSTQITTAEPGSEPRPLTSLLLHFPDSVPMWDPVWDWLEFLSSPIHPSKISEGYLFLCSSSFLPPASSITPETPGSPPAPRLLLSLPFSSAPGLLSGLSVLETGLQLASWLPFALENYLKCLVLAMW